MSERDFDVYATHTLRAPNPIARYAHTKRYDVALELVDMHLSRTGSLLDYGCSSGHFLVKLNHRRPDAALFGTDILRPAPNTIFTFVERLRDIPCASLDMVCSFEVLEHMFDNERIAFYSEVNRILKPQGVCIVSVPIIAGPILLVKYLNRAIFYQLIESDKYTLTELLRAAFLGIPAARPEGIRDTHKGFDFRKIDKAMEKNFQVLWKKRCPFSHLPWFFNSQLFIGARKK